jgi:small nuclear ribonucleoprotein (snRNP)-like protein
LTKSETAQIVQMQQKEKPAQQEIKTRKVLNAESNASAASSAKEAKMVDQLTNEYLQLNKAYNDAVTKYRNLFLVKGEDAEVTKRQLQTVTEYRAVLDRMDKNLNIILVTLVTIQAHLMV